jgi:dTDP-4-dehydrorhamnose reductase
MKKVLVLGGEGMLGHKAYQILSEEFDVYVTFLRFEKRIEKTGIFPADKIFDKVDAFQFDSFKKVIDLINPDVVFNCIGIIKQLKEAHNPKITIYINSLFPHLIAEYGSRCGFKLIHMSTDCIFSGKKGDYIEEDMSDADDLYGRSKFLGEVGYGNNLTLRTSIIGRELFSQNALVEWFLSQNKQSVKGYARSIYTGLTTIALCREVSRTIRDHPDLCGLYHVSADKIDKYALLNLIKKEYRMDISINPEYDNICDRSLDSSRYRVKLGFKPPRWEKMIKEMAEDTTPYNEWRQDGLR